MTVMAEAGGIKLRKKQMYAIMLAVLAAVFYAVSTPVSKVLLKYSGPTMLAAFLYLGAGAGTLLVFVLYGRKADRSAGLTRDDAPYTVGMIVLDIAAPILLMNGVERTTAANASLLGNFEIVATALIAYFIFHEKISGRMWQSIILIAASSALLSFEGTSSTKFSAGSLMVLGASVCWGLENNCTRMISSKSTYEIVILKGLFSGSGSLIIALASGEKIPAWNIIAGSSALGFVAYGLSIYTYIRAQNIIGAAKTSAFYAVAPFAGALIAFILLREEFTWRYAAGAAVMAAGAAAAIVDTLEYSHCHIHSHTVYHLRNGHLQKEIITHTHEHSHIGPGIAHNHMHNAI